MLFFIKFSSKQKLCGNCYKSKDKSEFYKDNTKPIGIRRICKMCDAKRRHECYERTKTVKKECNKKYYEKNAEKIKTLENILSR